ncbi:MAG: hypothetical protein H7268_12360 [Sandarakinorhabdus sp.]|nr:hypothetical protein [Sandarakinorhabdus sp.]
MNNGAVMTDGDGAVPPAFIHGVLATIRRRWWLLPAGMLAGLLLAGVYLARAQYLYSSELKVYAAPSSSGSRPQSPLGGLAALTGLGGGSEAVSPFRFYLDGVYSPEVANRMARDPAVMHTIFAGEWDARAKAWRQPSSLSGALRGLVAGLLGLPQFGWQAPDANRLQGFIADNVTIRQSVKTPIATIGFDYPDPVFAPKFILKLHQTVDDYLREQQAARTRGNIAYLAGKLETVTLAEQRQALVTSLTEQERLAMLAYGNAPYAADPFDQVTVSAEPTRPRPIPLLIGALVAGLILGAVAALLLAWRASAARPLNG